MNIVHLIAIFALLPTTPGISGIIDASSNPKNKCVMNTRDAAKPHDRPTQSRDCASWYVEFTKCGEDGLLRNHKYPELRWLCKITDRTVYKNNQIALNVNLIKPSEGGILQDDMGECQFVNPCKAQ
jgi:hypothetical protein